MEKAKGKVIAFFSSNTMCSVCQQILIDVARQYEAKLIVLSKSEFNRQTYRYKYISNTDAEFCRELNMSMLVDSIKCGSDSNSSDSNIKLYGNKNYKLKLGRVNDSWINVFLEYINNINKDITFQKLHLIWWNDKGLAKDGILSYEVLKRDPDIVATDFIDQRQKMQEIGKTKCIFFLQEYDGRNDILKL